MLDCSLLFVMAPLLYDLCIPCTVHSFYFNLKLLESFEAMQSFWCCQFHARLFIEHFDVCLCTLCSLRPLLSLCRFAFDRFISSSSSSVRFASAHLLVSMLVSFRFVTNTTCIRLANRGKQATHHIKGYNKFHPCWSAWLNANANAAAVEAQCRIIFLSSSFVLFFIFFYSRQVLSIFPLTNLWWNGIEPWENLN